MEILNRVSRLLKQKKLTISCAESCSGGLLSYLLTSIAGSSLYFKGAIICYSNESKNKLLGVSLKVLNEEGSVSKKVACVLSKNVRKIFNTDIGISITGVAGPTRDEKNNPVGRVYIGICFKRRVKVYMFNFKGTRNSIRKKASLQALKLIEEWIT